MKKNGFTVVELIVSFSLTVVITIFLVQIIMALNNLYNNSGVKTELLTKQSLISSQLNNKLSQKIILSLTDCGKHCIQFNYSDATNDILKIDYTTNVLTFGNYSTNLPEDTYFKNVSVDIIYAATIDETDNNAILNIKIPIKNDNINEEFYVNVAYQFNTEKTNIEYVNFAGTGSYIVLNGETEQSFNTQTAYVEQGYTVYNANGAVITGNVEVDNPLTNVPYKVGNYKIKYSLKDANGNIISQATRSINIKPSTYDITNLVTNGSFETDEQIFYSHIDTPSRFDLANISYDLTENYYGSRSLLLLPSDPTYSEGFVNGIARLNYDSSHKYYYSVVYKSESTIDLYCLTDNWWSNNVIFKETFVAKNNWTKASLYIYNPNLVSTNDLYYRLDNNNGGLDTKAYFDGLLFIDLTETFGAGNEPSKEWCDEHIEWFEGTTKINY